MIRRQWRIVEKGSLAEVTDDSCTVEFIEIVPLDRTSDDYHEMEFIAPVVEVKSEDLQLQEVKQEPVGENDTEDPNYSMKEEPADESENGDHNYCMKQERRDEYETDGRDGHGPCTPCFTIQVSRACTSNSFYPYWHTVKLCMQAPGFYQYKLL